MIRLTILMLVACGGAVSDDPTEATNTEPTDTLVDTADTGTTWGTTLADPPTDVTADCWAWTLDYEEIDLVGTALYTYDNGTALNITHYETDYEPDGLPNYISDYTYDGDALTQYTTDWDADGQLNTIYEYEYDAVTGLRSRYSEDLDADGQYEQVWTYDYDGDLRITAYNDEGDDGSIDLIYHYEYDGLDRPIRVRGDRDDDGSIDELVTYDYVDDVLPDVYVEYDEDNDGVPEETYDYTYDPLVPEQLITYEKTNTIGEYFLYNYEWNQDGDLDRRWGTVNSDGQDPYDYDQTYLYSAPGRVDTIAFNYDFGYGVYSYDQDWLWTCP